MKLLEKASEVLIEIGRRENNKKGKEKYREAKYGFIMIADKCIRGDQSVWVKYIRELRRLEVEREISVEASIILRENMGEIINYYKECLGIKRKEIKPSIQEVGSSEIIKEIECAICMGKHKKREVLCVKECKHAYGKECILEWLKVGKECPLCRIYVGDLYCYKERR
jgi:hypothetical protein